MTTVDNGDDVVVTQVNIPEVEINEEALPYQETERFCTWRKHSRDLYQQLFHVDLVWETPAAQLMPYVTKKNGLTTHTIMCGTRTGGQEQCFLQLLSATLPCDAARLDDGETPLCEATGEVGGYGMAPQQCGLQVDRRILHDGDVLAARYMYSNPLLVASSSSNGAVYIFDWSRISLKTFPNDPPRPRAPLPPNELSENPTDEDRNQYRQRLSALHAVATEQDRWDQRTGPGQHVLRLNGNEGFSDTLDWNTKEEGLLAAGSMGKVCLWSIGGQSKDSPAVLDPLHAYEVADEESRVNGVAFSWAEPHSFVCSSTSGALYLGDVRSPDITEMFSLPCAASSAALSPLDGNLLLTGGVDGGVYLYDFRKDVEPVAVEQLHSSDVTSLAWCPHASSLFASGSKDSNVCIYNVARKKTLFKHAGHTDDILDLGWNWQEDSAGQLLSGDSNAIMMWRPRDMFFTS
ncbi:histone-binding protein RBBP4 [Strigomonas culicis]|uniref:Histone-binding protein RBBP4 n=1 Tax=Strigomonas culicis TaxID=28005 RepID=S9TSN0_9TRYP|nr:histone-binding protein RBBP4 [Strigomonas culicis]EPY35695.1 histone-binding protein RBBP4 [Strigomonas culicis]EPY37231.1 histone-binding protein RBBP4 [Strigomonas culicis]|eukprot:EPY21407.1 histone-binding protein RBBP4 [Strigomonas culicis]